MNILLIEPKSPAANVFSFFKLPLLGLPILGAILKNAGHNVKINVENFSRINHQDGFKPDFVAVSTITPTANRGYEIADYFRQKGAKVMIGGVHATFMPEEAKKHGDYVVKGEGESVILDIVNGKHKKGIIEGSPVKNLDDLPFPDLSLMEKARNGLLKRLVGIFDKYAEVTPIQTSRGCPYSCSFCSVTEMFGRKYRFRSTENVMEEIRMKNPASIFFYDDNFAANPGRTKMLLEALIRKKEKTGKKMPWSAQVRTEVARDSELLDMMKRADCAYTYVGFESVNKATLENYKKKQDIRDIEECIRRLHEHDIKVHGMFVLGSDEDISQTIGQTLDFSERNRIDTIQYMILTPLPGSNLYKEFEKQGRILSTNWDLYDGHHTVFQPRNFRAGELENSVIGAMKRFYSFGRGRQLALKGDFQNAFYRFLGGYFCSKWQKSETLI